LITILAIETSGSSCSAALSVDGEIHEVFESAPRQHARIIMSMVDSLLTEAGMGVASIDALAFTRGPGSFTGLRIGFGVIQGMAFGANLPVIGLSTLQVMASKAATQYNLHEGALIAPALDARMDEIYLASYRVTSTQFPEAVLPDCVIRPEDALKLLAESLDAGIGDGWKLMDLEDKCPPVLDMEFTPDAKTVALIADELFRREVFSAIEDVELSYIRNEVSWKKRKKHRIVKNTGQV